MDQTTDADPLDAFNALVLGGDAGHYPFLAQLRASGPIHDGIPELGLPGQMEGADPTFSVYSFDLVSEVLSGDENFSSSPYGEMIGVVMGRTLLEMDEPEHRSYRLLLQQAFSKREMRRWEEEAVRPMIEQTIDSFAFRTERRAELVEDLCLPFPVRAIAAILGLPEEEYQQFQRLAIELISVQVDWDRAVAASQSLRDYFATVLAKRRTSPQRDMISVLAHAEAEGERLSDEDVYSFLRLLLPAGAETTYRTSSNLLCALLSDTEQLELLRADRSLIPRAVEEAVRWESPLQFVPRRARRDVMLGDTEIPSGATVSCHLGAANHDPDRFEDPDRFDFRRDGRGGVGFGFGVHTCLGMHLAKMETVAVIDAVLDRLPTLCLAPDQPAPQVTGTIMRSVPRIHVTW